MVLRSWTLQQDCQIWMLISARCTSVSLLVRWVWIKQVNAGKRHYQWVISIWEIFNKLVVMDIDNEGPIMRGLEAARQGPRVWTIGRRVWTIGQISVSCLHASRWRPVAEMGSRKASTLDEKWKASPGCRGEWGPRILTWTKGAECSGPQKEGTQIPGMINIKRHPRQVLQGVQRLRVPLILQCSFFGFCFPPLIWGNLSVTSWNETWECPSSAFFSFPWGTSSLAVS